jgi:multisubunit Na+/H+ antiporter MnhB subunit
MPHARDTLGWPAMREHAGLSLTIAGIIALGATLVGALVVVLTWTALTVYAVVRWAGTPDDPSPTTVLLVIVGVVTALALALGLAVAALGRSLAAPRSRRPDP